MPRYADAKGKILKAALKLFASKGYANTTVDQIVDEAGVNKALLYYYYKNKKELLTTISNDLIQDGLELSKLAFNDPDTKTSKEEIIELVSESYVDFLEKNKDTIRVILMESLKTSSEENFLFKFSEIIIRDEIKRLEDRGIKIDDDELQTLVAEFFLAVMPSISFAVYQTKFANYFGIGKEEVKEKFINALNNLHGAYHKVRESK